MWQSDDISPASYLFSHKPSNVYLKWTPAATTRLIGAEGQQAEVVVHSNSTVLFLKQRGSFISHYEENNNLKRLRSFTADTIPFSLQEIIIDAFQLFKNFVFYTERQLNTSVASKT